MGQTINNLGSPTLRRLTLQNVLPDLPVKQHQLPIHRQAGPLLGVVNTVLQVGQPVAVTVRWRGQGYRLVTHTRRVLPVSSSCIMPCFSSAVLLRRCSRAWISVSMSESTAAMASCSSKRGTFTTTFASEAALICTTASPWPNRDFCRMTLGWFKAYPRKAGSALFVRRITISPPAYAATSSINATLLPISSLVSPEPANSTSPFCTG